MKASYNRNYFPAAPFVDVSLITVAESRRVGPLPPLVDSGADGTIVPLAVLNSISAPPTIEMLMSSQWGESRPVLMYLVDVQIGDITLPGMEVVGDHLSDEIVLGRDVLNHLRVLLDGPAQTVTISE
jgi:predicted aspartyl protease